MPVSTGAPEIKNYEQSQAIDLYLAADPDDQCVQRIVLAGPQPFLDEPEDALVADPVFEEADNPLLGNFREDGSRRSLAVAALEDLIEFGRFAAQNCEKRGLSKPETFKFLGFVLICDKTRRGDFRIRRKSRGDRMRATLARIKAALRRRRHRPIPETGKWLAQVVGGYFAYHAVHAVPTNGLALSAFRYHVTVLWHRQLCRRSQRAWVLRERMAEIADAFLPKPKILHPWPSVRFAVNHPR